MAYKINSNTVIDSSNTAITGSFIRGAGLILKNDNGEIFIRDTSPMVGTVAGYAAGGFSGSNSNVIDKFPFATDSNATDVGDLTVTGGTRGNQSSVTHGYTSGGGGPPPSGNLNIEKFPFAINNNATDVGDLTQTRTGPTGQSSSSHGYTSGGGLPSPGTSVNTIDRFPFSSDSNASDVGDLSQIRAGTGHSSATDGFTAGAYSFPPPISVNTIDRFPFSTNTNASDVGDLAVITGQFVSGGKSSTTHGYVAGGGTGPVPSFLNTIQKFQFATSANGTDVADLAVAEGRGGSGQNSVVSGYHSGGRTPTENYADDIQKFTFATDSNASNIGSLTVGRYYAVGQQD